MKNLKLNNGQTATFKYIDNFSRPVYKLENKALVCCIDLNGTNLHTITRSGEPECPLIFDFQPTMKD